jgi:hypothetical protein
LHWSGPILVGSGTVRAAGLIQSNFGAGNLEVVARLDGGLDHYYAEPAAGSWTWHGPDVAWREPVLDPATFGGCEVAFKPGGPSAIHVCTLADGRAFCFGFGDGGMDPDPGAFVIDPVRPVRSGYRNGDPAMPPITAGGVIALPRFRSRGRSRPDDRFRASRSRGPGRRSGDDPLARVDHDRRERGRSDSGHENHFLRVPSGSRLTVRRSGQGLSGRTP